MLQRGGAIVTWGGIVVAALFVPGGLPLLAWALYRRRSEALRLLAGKLRLDRR
jgi:hypothetical protein